MPRADLGGRKIELLDSPPLPPGAPPERVAALRQAFLQALNDKQLLADAKNLNLDIDILAGERLQTVVNDVYKTPPQVIERAKLALNNGVRAP